MSDTFTKYTCEICGSEFTGYRRIELHIPPAAPYDDDRHLFSISACWPCRWAIDEAARAEMDYQGKLGIFLRDLIEDHRKFKGVINRQVFDD